MISCQTDECEYLNTVLNILQHGVKRPDRTGTGTISIFGGMMKFSLRDNIFPLLTTKKVYFKGVVLELLWMIKGSTNSNLLSEKMVKIWDGNGTREFLDSRGLVNNKQGDLGPIYGFQWRHFGATYIDCDTNYTGQGIDQLQNCIDLIKSNPSDRRIVLNAWNPLDIDKMALPPCHMMCQFFVAEGELSCLMYQRSADFGLGVPFNIASYALLTIIIAHVTNLKPGEFTLVSGDSHIYLNHIDALYMQSMREPRPFPHLKIINTHKMDIDSFTLSDFELTGYDPYPTIPMTMSV